MHTTTIRQRPAATEGRSIYPNEGAALRGIMDYLAVHLPAELAEFELERLSKRLIRTRGGEAIAVFATNGWGRKGLLQLIVHDEGLSALGWDRGDNVGMSHQDRTTAIRAVRFSEDEEWYTRDSDLDDLIKKIVERTRALDLPS